MKKQTKKELAAIARQEAKEQKKEDRSWREFIDRMKAKGALIEETTQPNKQ